MVSIRLADKNDVELVAEMGGLTFLESHGHSAPPDVIAAYEKRTYNSNMVEAELEDTANIYHIITYNDSPAGYSKIILNTMHPAIKEKNVTKLERLYLLKKFYDLKLGHTLFQFNIALSKTSEQTAMWLYTWKANLRAVNFYTKEGFEIIGSYDFKLAASHANPNHLMYLRY